jgi:hypothetical protein
LHVNDAIFSSSFNSIENKFGRINPKGIFMKTFFLVGSLFISTLTFAKVHREHAAHKHGSGTMGIAFDGATGQLDFKIPSESIFGFEHEAKSEKDKKAKTEGLEKLETKITELVVFDPTLNCKFAKNKLEVVPEAEHSGHSETIANFTVTCDKSPVGSKMTFNFQKYFPRIKDLDVQVLAGDLQKTVEAKKNGTTLDLK